MNNKTANLIYGIPFFAGLILQIIAIDLFRLTFISTTISVGLYLFSGLIGFLVLWRKLKGTFKYKLLDVIVALTFCIVSIGGTLTFLFLAANYYPVKSKPVKHIFPIVKTGTLGRTISSGCAEPFAAVEKDGLLKEIVFTCNLPENISSYKSVDLAISKGALGFDIIRDKQLIK
jgi:hypothetical protein